MLPVLHALVDVTNISRKFLLACNSIQLLLRMQVFHVLETLLWLNLLNRLALFILYCDFERKLGFDYFGRNLTLLPQNAPIKHSVDAKKLANPLSFIVELNTSTCVIITSESGLSCIKLM